MHPPAERMGTGPHCRLTLFIWEFIELVSAPTSPMPAQSRRDLLKNGPLSKSLTLCSRALAGGSDAGRLGVLVAYLQERCPGHAKGGVVDGYEKGVLQPGSWCQQEMCVKSAVRKPQGAHSREGNPSWRVLPKSEAEVGY
jgi:hypothetical protein